MRNQEITVKIPEMSWHFSAPVIDAFEEMGIPIPSGLTSFILRALSKNVVREGSTNFPMIGLGLRIAKDRNEFKVDLVEESEIDKRPR